MTLRRDNLERRGLRLNPLTPKGRISLMSTNRGEAKGRKGHARVKVSIDPGDSGKMK